MVQTKRPPSVKWNPYEIGENKSRITKEINQIVANKEHRRKVGLELGSLREFKGNTHWNLYISIELAEIFAKRLNDDLRILFLQNAQGLNSTSSFLKNISEQLKKTEFNLNNVTTLSGNNMVKVIRAEVANINKYSANLAKIQKGIDAKIANLQSTLEQTAGELKETLSENIQNILKELSERNEALQTVILDDLKTLKEKHDAQIAELSKHATGLNDKTSESIKSFSEHVTKDISGLDTNINNLHEQVTTFQEATNNVLDDQQNTIVNEFQQGIGGLMKQNLENFENLKKGNTSHTKEVITQIDQTTDSLSSIMEATNAHMDKTTENINENVQNTEEQFKKELNTEITDLRAILSTIRSDIELMKSVLTKVDSKVH